jgi:hypothetical protein
VRDPAPAQSTEASRPKGAKYGANRFAACGKGMSWQQLIASNAAGAFPGQPLHLVSRSKNALTANLRAGSRRYVHAISVNLTAKSNRPSPPDQVRGHVFCRAFREMRARGAVAHAAMATMIPTSAAVGRANPVPTVAHLLIMHARVVDIGCQIEHLRRQPSDCIQHRI